MRNFRIMSLLLGYSLQDTQLVGTDASDFYSEDSCF
jgi:hypothetical protein